MMRFVGLLAIAEEYTQYSQYGEFVGVWRIGRFFFVGALASSDRHFVDSRIGFGCDVALAFHSRRFSLSRSCLDLMIDVGFRIMGGWLGWYECGMYGMWTFTFKENRTDCN